MICFKYIYANIRNILLFFVFLKKINIKEEKFSNSQVIAGKEFTVMEITVREKRATDYTVVPRNITRRYITTKLSITDFLPC